MGLTQEQWEEYLKYIRLAPQEALNEEELAVRKELEEEEKRRLDAARAYEEAFPPGSWRKMFVEEGGGKTALHAAAKALDTAFVPLRGAVAQLLHTATGGEGKITSPKEAIEAINPLKTTTYPSMVELAERSAKQHGGWGEMTSDSIGGKLLNVGLDAVTGIVPGVPIAKAVSLPPRVLNTKSKAARALYGTALRLIDPAHTLGQAGEAFYMTGMPGLRAREIKLLEDSIKKGAPEYIYGSRTKELIELPGVWGSDKRMRSALAKIFRENADIARDIEKSTVEKFPGVVNVDLNIKKLPEMLSEKDLENINKTMREVSEKGFSPFEAREEYLKRLLNESVEPKLAEELADKYLASFAMAKDLPRIDSLIMSKTELPWVQKRWVDQAADASAAYSKALRGDLPKTEYLAKRRAAETTRDMMKRIVQKNNPDDLAKYEKALKKVQLADETLDDIASSAQASNATRDMFRSGITATAMGVSGAGPFATGTYVSRRIGEGAMASPILTTLGRGLYLINKHPIGRGIVQSSYMQGLGALDDNSMHLQ